jgi:hypothetical protein
MYLKFIVVGILVVERVISRILGVKRVIVGIHFTKKCLELQTRVYWRLNRKLEGEISFFVYKSNEPSVYL